MTFGAEPWGCGEKDAHKIIAKFLDAGGNFIDTADVYAGARPRKSSAPTCPT
jgi:aryl-alcohol dehydrogenase-like predicted oxidoreductase